MGRLYTVSDSFEHGQSRPSSSDLPISVPCHRHCYHIFKHHPHLHIAQWSTNWHSSIFERDLGNVRDDDEFPDIFAKGDGHLRSHNGREEFGGQVCPTCCDSTTGPSRIRWCADLARPNTSVEMPSNNMYTYRRSMNYRIIFNAAIF